MEFRYTGLSFSMLSLLSNTEKVSDYYFIRYIFLSISENSRFNYYSHYQFPIKTISDYFSKPLSQEKTLSIHSN
jgi:hypothetical protein